MYLKLNWTIVHACVICDTIVSIIKFTEQLLEFNCMQYANYQYAYTNLKIRRNREHSYVFLLIIGMLNN